MLPTAPLDNHELRKEVYTRHGSLVNTGTRRISSTFYTHSKLRLLTRYHLGILDTHEEEAGFGHLAREKIARLRDG
jgi:hypothetical protein